MLLPNLITLLALCAGLTAIRLAVEEKLEWAVAAIVFAALLDGIDGRIARLLKGTSRFGAELDSLADFVNFGVAPALMVYFWSLHELKSAGWIAAMVFAISTGLRLARFNVMVDEPNKPVWAANFFVGMPAPAGAITVLLPIYVNFLGMPRFAFMAPVTLVYTLAIAFLMVSRLPVFSGKRVGKRVAPEMVLPVFVAVVLFFALLVAYPWGGAYARHDRVSREPSDRLDCLSRLSEKGRCDGTGRLASCPACRLGKRLSLALPEPSRAPAGSGKAGTPQLTRACAASRARTGRGVGQMVYRFGNGWPGIRS